MAAEKAKEAGNAAFKQGQLELALAHYTTAVQIDPSCSTYVLNRSLVHLKRKDFKAALKDANRSIELVPSPNPKAYFRRGLASKGLKDYQGARQDFEMAIKEGAGPEVKAELDSLPSPSDDRNDRLRKAAAASTATTTNGALMKEVSTTRRTKDESFKDKKAAREQRESSSPAVAPKRPPSPARPPLPSVRSEPKALANPSVPPAKVEQGTIPSSVKGVKTAYEFETSWRNRPDKASRQALVLESFGRRPEDVAELFGNSLTPDLLSEVVEVIGSMRDEDWRRKLGWLDGLSRVRRFDSLSAFMTDQEKQVVKDELEKARDEIARIEKAFGLL